MAKKKDEQELNKIKNTLVKLNCGKCNAVKNTTYPNPSTGYGGIKCQSCNTFDDFYGEYIKEGKNYSWVSLYNYYKENTSAKAAMKNIFILECKNAKQIYDFFKENQYSPSETNNAIAQLGISLSNLKEYYPNTSSNEEIELQKKNEVKITKQIKKLMKN